MNAMLENGKTGGTTSEKAKRPAPGRRHIDAKRLAVFIKSGDMRQSRRLIELEGVVPEFTHLKLAAERGDKKIARYLVDRGVQPSLADIHRLVDDEAIGTIYFLLKSGVPPQLFMSGEAATPTGQTAWGLAECHGDQKTLEVFKLAARDTGTANPQC